MERPSRLYARRSQAAFAELFSTFVIEDKVSVTFTHVWRVMSPALRKAGKAVAEKAFTEFKRDRGSLQLSRFCSISTSIVAFGEQFPHWSELVDFCASRKFEVLEDLDSRNWQHHVVGVHGAVQEDIQHIQDWKLITLLCKLGGKHSKAVYLRQAPRSISIVKYNTGVADCGFPMHVDDCSSLSQVCVEHVTL